MANPSFQPIALCTMGLFISDVLNLYLVFKAASVPVRGESPNVSGPLSDTLVEGVLLMDLDQRIALVNESSVRTAGKPASELEGRKAGELSWSGPEGQVTKDDLPGPGCHQAGIARRQGPLPACKTAGFIGPADPVRQLHPDRGR